MDFNNNLQKRRAWTEDEKKTALKHCAGKCACCGKKLTFKSMTMDHVVPFSKGGENTIENLVALCFNCNQAKANLLYHPKGFYMALNSSHMTTISKYFNHWFFENYTKDNLIEKPLLYEGISMYYQFAEHRPLNLKNGVIVPNLIYDLFEVFDDNIHEYLKDTGLSEKDIYKAVPDRDKLFSVYCGKSRVSQTISTLFIAQVVDNHILIVELYSKSYKTLSILAYTILNMNSVKYVEYNIPSIVFCCLDPKTPEYMIKHRDTLEIPYRVHVSCYETASLTDDPNKIFHAKNIIEFAYENQIMKAVKESMMNKNN